MKVSCPACQTHYNIDDKRIPAGGAKLKCAKCQTMFPIKPATPAGATPVPQGGDAAVPLPGREAAVPLPGGHGSAETSEAIPLPGGPAGLGSPEAIPLPGISGAGSVAIPLPGGPTSVAIPLPGVASSGSVAIPLPGGPTSASVAIPLPGVASSAPTPLATTPVPSGAVPLPGGPVSPRGGAIPLPDGSATASGSGAVPLPSGGAIPLPGGPPGSSAFGSGAVPLPSGGGAIPLPGGPAGSSASGSGAVPLPGRGSHAGASAAFGAPPAPGSLTPSSAFLAGTDAIALPGGPGAVTPVRGSVPLPGPRTIPLPGASPRAAAPSTSTFDRAEPVREPTDRWDRPLHPRGESAVPLPDHASRGAVPLPGASAGASPAIPLPASDRPWDSGPIPLPDGAPPAGSGQQAPDAWGGPAAADESDWSDIGFADASPRAPAPTAVDAGFAAGEDVDFATADDVDFASADDVAPAADWDAAQFPPEGPGSQVFEEADERPTRTYDLGALATGGLFSPEQEAAGPAAFDFGELPAPPPSAPLPAPPGFDFSAAPPAPPAFDFAELPTPAAPAFDFGAPGPAASPAFDFGAPASAAPPAFDFGDLPSPTGAPAFDFGAPPPAAPPAFDFGDPAPSAPPAFDFGDPAPAAAPAFDFGDPAPAAAPAFDFGDLPSPASTPSLDFGAEQSEAAGDYPAPVNAQPFSAPDPSFDFGAVDFGGDGDAGDAASDFFGAGPAGAGAADPGPEGPTFSVRRRSGKVFGPFEAAAIVQMLEEGQLLGNEDVSGDGASWGPIGAQEPFAGTIQRMMAGAGTRVEAATRSSAPPPSLQEAARTPASRDQLPQDLESRPSPSVRPERGVRSNKGRALVMGLAAALVLVVGGGVALGFTPYGYFGLKKLLPARIQPGTQESAALLAVGDALLDGSRGSLVSARDRAAKVLALKEFPELRAAWSQVVFALHRRFEERAPADLARARASIEEVALLGERDPALVKLQAAEALDAAKGPRARELLQGAGEASREDPVVLLMLAEAQLLEKDPVKARASAERVLTKHPKSGRAHHLLGQLSQAQARAREEARDAEAAKLASIPETEADRQTEVKAALAKADAARTEALEQAATSYRAALAAAPGHLESAIALATLELEARDAVQAALDALAPTLLAPAEAELSGAQRAEALSLSGAALIRTGKDEEAEAQLRKALELEPQHPGAQAALARLFFKRRALADALPLFESVTKRDPKNLEAAEGYVSALLATGNHEEARKQVESANGRFLGNARLAYLFGRVEDALGNALEAEGHYKRALNADPTLHEAALHLARFYLRGHRIQEARTLLEGTDKAAQQSPMMRVVAGELALAEGRAGDAQVQFATAVQSDPKLADGYFGRSRVALAQGRLDEARADAQQTLTLNPALPEARLQLGLVLWRQGDLEGALTELQRGRQETPRSVPTAIALGEVQLAKGQLAEAEQTLRDALRLDPTHDGGLAALGRTLGARGQYAAAIDSLRSAVDRAPQNASYVYELGRVYQANSRPEEAWASWKKASELDPAYAEPHEALGLAALAGNRFQESVRHLERALALAPDRHHLLASIGDAHFNATQWESAIRSYQEALKRDPSLKRLNFQIGRAYSESERVQAALPWLQRATAAEPDNAPAWVALGYALKVSGRKGEAVTAFRKYLELRPDAPDRRDIDDELYGLLNE